MVGPKGQPGFHLSGRRLCPWSRRHDISDRKASMVRNRSAARWLAVYADDYVLCHRRIGLRQGQRERHHLKRCCLHAFRFQPDERWLDRWWWRRRQDRRQLELEGRILVSAAEGAGWLGANK